MDNPRVTLNIQNNLSYPTTINILGNPYNLRDTSNATTEYRWNITALIFTNEDSLILQYKLKSATSFSNYSSNLNSANIQAVIDALNNLGIGYFNTYVSGGQTFISTYNDQYAYGQLNIYSASGTSLGYQFTQTGVGGSAVVKVNGVTKYTYTSGTSQVAKISGVNVGDTISYSGVATSLGINVASIEQVNNQTQASNNLYTNNVPASNPFSTSFVAQAGISYTLKLSD